MHISPLTDGRHNKFDESIRSDTSFGVAIFTSCVTRCWHRVILQTSSVIRLVLLSVPRRTEFDRVDQQISHLPFTVQNDLPTVSSA